jgi:VRR-NUC domain
VEDIADCVGGAGLAAVCALLAEDYSGWRGGMPDLLLWKPAARAAKLAEVKGPRDRLSEQQRAWMAALEAAGLQVEVLKVGTGVCLGSVKDLGPGSVCLGSVEDPGTGVCRAALTDRRNEVDE